MDHEMRFLAALLHAPKNEQSEFYSKQIPKGIFTIREEEIRWVYEFRTKYGQYPSPTAFFHKFNQRLVTPDDPFQAVLQPILDRAMYDQMVQVQEQTKEELDSGAPLNTIMARWKERAAKVTEFSYEYTDVNLEISEAASSGYRERLKAKKGESVLYTSPWETMNKIIQFFLPKELYTLVARPSMGKTWIVLMMGHWFASLGLRVLMISKEMGTEVLENRVTCIRFKLSYPKFRSAELLPKDLRRWRKEKAAFKKSGKTYPFFLSGSETFEGTAFGHIQTQIEKYKPQIVIVDGAYLLYPEGLPKNANDVQRFTMISNRSKTLAKANKVFWMNVIQHGRKAENIQGETKGAAITISGSDSWYQDSDWVHSIGGVRGSEFREHDIIKARESPPGGFATNFKLHPFPDFSEIQGVLRVSDTAGTVSFKGIG
jgi:hypothetical protein